MLANTQAYPGGRVAAFWDVVPDRVASVTVSFPSPGSRARSVTETSRPVHNVLVIREPYRAPVESGFPSRIALRAADGSVIKRVAVDPLKILTLCGYGC